VHLVWPHAVLSIAVRGQISTRNADELVRLIASDVVRCLQRQRDLDDARCGQQAGRVCVGFII
jgi:hypothetical protein